MDLGLSERQEMLKDNARTFFERECPRTLVRELLATPDAHSPKLWADMADLGWLGLPFPEQYGGLGGSFLDLAIILEEMGRALLPGPYFSTMLLGGYSVLDAGTAAQKEDILPKVAEGKLILTMAFLESGAAYDPSNVTLEAQEEGDDYVLNGTKLFVPNAHIADLILTVARVANSGRGSASVLLVNPRLPGVSTTLLRPIDDSKLCELTLRNVRVPRRNILGEIGQGRSVVSKTLARAAVAECLQLIGGVQVSLEMTIEHAKQRVQFDKPIGAFQAVQHHCANMVMDLEGARLLTYQAAWLLSEGRSCEKEVALAKAWVSDACFRAQSRAQQVHGGSGFIEDHDLTLYFKRVAAGEIAYGGSNYHYKTVEDKLGL